MRSVFVKIDLEDLVSRLAKVDCKTLINLCEKKIAEVESYSLNDEERELAMINMIQAIKLLRMRTGLSLKDCKDMVDEHKEQRSKIEHNTNPCNCDTKNKLNPGDKVKDKVTGDIYIVRSVFGEQVGTHGGMLFNRSEIYKVERNKRPASRVDYCTQLELVGPTSEPVSCGNCEGCREYDNHETPDQVEKVCENQDQDCGGEKE